MKKSTALIPLFSVFLFGSIFALPKIAQAQQANSANSLSLTAIPPRMGENFELKAAPGEVIQATVRVRNSSEQAMSVESAFQDFILGEDGKTPLAVSEEVSSRWSMTKWVTISPARQIVEPRDSATVNVVINVPKDALPGGHYGMVLHQPSLVTAPKSGSQSSIGQRVGTLIYFVVDGPINEEAFVRDVTFPSFTEFGPVPFSFTVDNVSDVHIHPQLGIEIYNLFGQKVDNIQVESQNVFPFVPRKFEGKWARIWGIGRYQAKVVMSYGSEAKVAIAQTYFWLLPVKLVIALVVIILALIGMGIAIRRHLIHRREFSEEKIEMLEEKIKELEQTQQQSETQPEEKK